MAKVIIKNADDFLILKGQFLGESEWFVMSQEVINHFANATYDHQWIHVDPGKAKQESSYGTTIAHGYLTLSLLPHLLDEIIQVDNLRQLVNYSIDKMIYKSVVPVNSRVRLCASLKNAKDLGDIVKADITCKFEIEGQDTPALEGTIIYLYYFK